MATNFTGVGQEVQVNTVFDRPQTDAYAAAVTDGRFAVAYTRDFSNFDTDIRLQFVNADGMLSGSMIAIDNDSGLQGSAAIAPRAGGGAVVVWTDRDGKDAGGSDITHAIQLRMVSSTGVLSTPLTVADSGTIDYSNPVVAALADGRVVVVFDSVDALGPDLRIRIVNSTGTVSSSLGIHGAVTNNENSRDPAIAASGNNALIAYETISSGDIRVKLFNDATVDLETATSNLVASAGDLGNPDVAALTGGRYVIVWENNSNGDVEGRFIDANGSPLGATFTIANNAGDNENPRVAALPDGGFIVTWENDAGLFAPENGGDEAVLARRFDSTGAAAGDLFMVNTGDAITSQFSPTVAVNPGTGRTFFAWTDYHAFTGTGQDNDPPGIRGRAFAPTTDMVNGTPTNDTIATYNFSETINGLAGNDTINARGGNDSVNGGLGNDLILAGLGNDTVVGSDGADKLDGESGSDLVNGGLGNDSLTGGPDADRFVFNAAIKPKGSNVDTITDFAAPNDTILLDNAIFTKLKTAGALKAKYFEVGKKADGGKDAIIYNKKSGDLLYDQNGDKKGGALLFAKLEGSPDDVSAADFLVI